MDDNELKVGITILRKIAETIKEACENCQEFDCYGCKYYHTFNIEVLEMIEEE